MSWEILKDSINVYKHSNIHVFTRAGLFSSLVLIVFFAGIQFLKLNIGPVSLDYDLLYIIIYILLAFLSALFTSSLFWTLGKNYGPKIGYLLVTNKILKIVLTKGDSHYFEKIGESERKIGPNLVINKFINLLLTWLAVTAFLIGTFIPIIGPFLTPIGGNPEIYVLNFLNAGLELPLYFIIKLLFVFFLSPILLLVVIPIPWMLIDTQLKSYSSGIRINHMVGRLVQQRVASIFAIGGVITLILINPTNLNFYFALLGFCILFIGFPVALVSFFYNLLFQLEYYDEFIKIIPVPLGTTSVVMESKFKAERAETVSKDLDTLNDDETSEKSYNKTDHHHQNENDDNSDSETSNDDNSDSETSNDDDI